MGNGSQVGLALERGGGPPRAGTTSRVRGDSRVLRRSYRWNLRLDEVPRGWWDRERCPADRALPRSLLEGSQGDQKEPDGPGVSGRGPAGRMRTGKAFPAGRRQQAPGEGAVRAAAREEESRERPKRGARVGGGGRPAPPCRQRDRRPGRGPNTGPRRLTCRPPQGPDAAGGAESGSAFARREFKYRRLERAANQRATEGETHGQWRPMRGRAGGCASGTWVQRRGGSRKSSGAAAYLSGRRGRVVHGWSVVAGAVIDWGSRALCGCDWVTRKGWSLRAAYSGLSFPSCKMGPGAAPPSRRVVRRSQTLGGLAGRFTTSACVPGAGTPFP